MGTSRPRTGGRAVCTTGRAVYIWLAANLLRSFCCTDTQTLPQRGNGVCIISLDRQHSQHSQICSPIMSTQRRRSEFPISLSAGSGTGTICAPLAPPSCRPRHCTKYSPVAVVVVLATHPEVCRTHMSNPNLHTSETCFVTAARDYCCSL